MTTRYQYAGNFVRSINLELSQAITQLGLEFPEIAKSPAMHTILQVEKALGFVAAEFAQQQADAPCALAPAQPAAPKTKPAGGIKVPAMAQA
jgi:hypothetical protein